MLPWRRTPANTGGISSRVTWQLRLAASVTAKAYSVWAWRDSRRKDKVK